MSKFDVIVIGAGPGGYVAAIRAAQLGMNTALVEKEKRLGGTCLNIGCIPSKALLESSELFYETNHSFAEHGIVTGKTKMDITALMNRKTKIVNTLTDGIAMLMKKNKITVFNGNGSLISAGVVKVDALDGSTQEINCDNVILAMGSMPAELPFMKFDGKNIVSSTETLAFDKVPKSMCVIGAGAIGLEMGSVWARLGSKVSVIEMLPRVAPFADTQLSSLLMRSLTAQGLEFHLSAKVTAAKVGAKDVTLNFTDKDGKEQAMNTDVVLVAVGRKPNSRNSNLETAGVKMLPNGMVETDAHFQTNLKGVYAIGDLITGPMLAHKASEEGAAVAEIIAGQSGHVNYKAIPNVIYTNPELAVVGISEEEAKEQKIDYKTGKMFFRGNGRALSLGQAEGMVKFVVDAKSDKVLGCHILAPRASELIAEMVLAIEFSATAEDIARTCHAHPTLSEVIKEAALAVDKRQIHG